MNERGFFSITALFIMLILAIMTAEISNFAARQADIVSNHKMEIKLQNAAENVFNEAVFELINDPDLLKNIGGYTKTDWQSDAELLNTMGFTIGKIEARKDKNINDITVHVYLRKYRKQLDKLSTSEKEVHKFIIVIMTLAEKSNYNFKYSAYQRVYGYLGRIVTRNTDGTNDLEDGKYEFKSYFY